MRLPFGKSSVDPRVKELLDLPENKVCAECGDDQQPRWCSVTLGVVICADCAGVHRKLGASLSVVQSASDRWKDPWIEKLSAVGNKVGAQIYEASLPQCWPRPRAQAAGGDGTDASAAAHLENFLRAKYETRLFARADARLEVAATEEEEPFAEEFSVLLRRGAAKEPFGFAPLRPALRRGVLEIKAPMTPSTPAGQWNDAQENGALELQQGDCILSVNGVVVCKEDAGAAALQLLKQEQQVLLAVLRPRPSNHSHGYEQLMGVAYGLFNPGKLNSIKALLAKNPGGEKALFIRICSKYCASSEDWHDLFDGIAERCTYIDGGGPRAVRMATKAVAKLKGLSAGDEPGLLQALCRHLLEDVNVESADVEANDAQLTVASKASLPESTLDKLDSNGMPETSEIKASNTIEPTEASTEGSFWDTQDAKTVLISVPAPVPESVVVRNSDPNTAEEVPAPSDPTQVVVPEPGVALEQAACEAAIADSEIAAEAPAGKSAVEQPGIVEEASVAEPSNSESVPSAPEKPQPEALVPANAIGQALDLGFAAAPKPVVPEPGTALEQVPCEEDPFAGLSTAPAASEVAAEALVGTSAVAQPGIVEEASVVEPSNSESVLPAPEKSQPEIGQLLDLDFASAPKPDLAHAPEIIVASERVVAHDTAVALENDPTPPCELGAAPATPSQSQQDSSPVEISRPELPQDTRMREPSPELPAPRASPQGRGSVSGEPAKGEHLSWPQHIVTLRLPEASAGTLGIRHAKVALRELRLLLVKGVVADSPAAVAGLRKGDVVELIGGEDPIEYLVASTLRGQEKSRGAEAAEIHLTLRRQIESTDL